MTNNEVEKTLREHPGQQSVECKVCLKEISVSAAHTFECEDYVYYFCGAECFDQWEHQQEGKNHSNEDKQQGQ